MSEGDIKNPKEEIFIQNAPTEGTTDGGTSTTEGGEQITEFDIKFDKYCLEWNHITNREKLSAFILFSMNFSKQFLPVAFIFCFYVMINISNIMFVSHADNEDLFNGVGFGLNLYNMIAVTISLGISSALDTFCPHAFGAKQFRLMGCYLNRCRFIMTCVFVPVFFILFFIDELLIAIGQDKNVSLYAGEFCKGLLPGLIFFYYTDAQRRFLQAQNIVNWPVLVIIITSVLHPVWIWILTSVFGLGAFGNGFSISITNTLNFFLILIVTKKQSHPDALVPIFIKETFTDIIAFFRIALPSMFMVCLEGWNYQIITVCVGYLAFEQRSAHLLLLNFSSIVYMFPFALSVTASNTVGKYIGRYQPQSAEICCKMIVIFTSLVSLTLFIIMNCFRWAIPMIFTDNEGVIDIMETLLLYYFFYELFDFLTTSYAGMFRGLGLQKVIAIANLLCFYIISIPLAILLCFEADLGIYGIWLSYVIVIVLLISVYSFIYYFKVDFYDICKVSHKRLSVAQSAIDSPSRKSFNSMKTIPEGDFGKE